jgi:DNA-binding response OmpR family regulator
MLDRSTPASSDVPAPVPEERGDTSTILVVDDEALARQMFTDLLEAKGFRVISVAVGEEAFPWLEEVDLVLLDAMLPGRDGWAICREIKAQHDPLLPVIMVTARTAPEDVVRTFDAGADDYVAKPFHVAELTARIESRLRVHRAEKALRRANRRLADLASQNYQLYEQARRDAEERSHLLRELDHRVRNNLAVITGLVGLERNRRPPRPTAEALASLENRLRSFLMVHEALRAQSYRHVPIRDIAQRLLERLRNVYDRDRRIGISIEGERLLLDENQGFPLALALNELITNAFRHAFTGEAGGRVEVRIIVEGEEIAVRVRDDGVGGGGLDAPDVQGGGRAIVAALVERELNGRIEYPPVERGTCVSIVFPAGSDAP